MKDYESLERLQPCRGSASAVLILEDVDATLDKAMAAGAKATSPLSDMFWGDRMGNFIDPFGHSWGVATHQVDLTPDQVAKGSEEFFKQLAAEPKP